MKQIVSNYSYSPTTNVVTLTGVNIEQDQLLLVVAPQVGRTMYNFASGVTGVVSAGDNTRVTLNASTAGLTTTSPLVIFYDDHASTQTVAGTVTANVLGYDPYNGVYPSLPITRADDGIAGADNVVKVAIATELGGVNDSAPLPISGTVTVGNSVTIGSLPAISGTVTARTDLDAYGNSCVVIAFDSPAGVQTAVTKSDRKYLLIQNVTTGSNVITVGIGFTPTTTQGIQLTAGAGITFESSYIPTGAVYVLSSVTASNFTILEA